MGNSFTIIGQQQVIDLGSGGAPQNAMRIDFKSLPSGTLAYVTIPLAQYTPVEAKRQIDARVALIEEVHALGDN